MDSQSELEKLETSLSMFQQNFQNKQSNPGSSEQNPVTYCFKIQLLYKNKKNGYYWIQPECSEKALRVYCDFSQNQDYYFLPNFNNRNFTKRQDIVDECASVGLSPIEVYDEVQVDSLIYYLNDIKCDLMSPKAIPLGFDYTCQNVLVSFRDNVKKYSDRFRTCNPVKLLLNYSNSWTLLIS